MPEQLTDGLRALRETATSLAGGPLAALRDRTDLTHRRLRAEVATAARRAGTFGLTQPAEAGGSAGTAMALAVVREVFAHHDVAHLPGLFGPSPGVLAGVDEPLRSQFLEPMLAGRLQGAFGFTEPDRAERHTWAATDGDDLVVNGEKSYVTGGADADFVNTLVELDDTGPALVLIPTDIAGVEIARRFDSFDGSHHAAVRFTDARVPRTHVIGRPGRGLGRAVEQVSAVRMAMAATCVGYCQLVVDHVGRYLAAPHRSGEPLASSERHRLRYGQMRIAAYTARSVLYRTARIVDAGENAVNECMAAKYVATETVGELVDAAIQTIGGQALVSGHVLETIHRRVRVLRLAEGPTDVLALNVARGDLDLGKGRL